VVIVLLLATALTACAQSSKPAGPVDDKVKKLCENLPFTMPEIHTPSFPEFSVKITEFGAKSDGRTLNTKPFADAIRACAKGGGGTVVVPPGTWLTGPISLESSVNLHLDRGAVIQFSRKIEDFPLIPGLDGKSKKYIVTPPISAYGASNIGITGEGIIDGAGEFWRYVKKEKLTERHWKDLVSSGGVVSPDGKEWWPSKEALEGEAYIKKIESSGKELTAADYAKAKEYLRPDLVRFVRCKGILLDGPTFQNSPRFHVHPVDCENLIVRNIKIFAEWYTQNGDGLDLSSCRNAVVYNVTASVGDDGICVKPGSSSMIQTGSPSCENIVIADCEVYRAHGGFVIGSESFGGARNIAVRNCVFVGTDVGLRFKSVRGRGGLVENVFIDGIQMRGIANEAILFDMFYGGGAPEDEAAKQMSEVKAEAVNDRTPRFRNFSIRNVVCNGARRALLIHGLPEMSVSNVTIEHAYIMAQKGALCRDADSISIADATLALDESPVVSLTQCRNITLTRLTYSGIAPVFLQADGARTAGVRIVDVDLSKASKGVELGKDVSADAVMTK